jgi:hypothetical protein
MRSAAVFLQFLKYRLETESLDAQFTGSADLFAGDPAEYYARCRSVEPPSFDFGAQGSGPQLTNAVIC